ncbi:MAG: hypothetical protein WDN69_15560 [Aliidongia sp.]
MKQLRRGQTQLDPVRLEISHSRGKLRWRRPINLLGADPPAGDVATADTAAQRYARKIEIEDEYRTSRSEAAPERARYQPAQFGQPPAPCGRHLV